VTLGSCVGACRRRRRRGSRRRLLRGVLRGRAGRAGVGRLLTVRRPISFLMLYTSSSACVGCCPGPSPGGQRQQAHSTAQAGGRRGQLGGRVTSSTWRSMCACCAAVHARCRSSRRVPAVLTGVDDGHGCDAGGALGRAGLEVAQHDDVSVSLDGADRVCVCGRAGGRAAGRQARGRLGVSLRGRQACLQRWHCGGWAARLQRTQAASRRSRGCVTSAAAVLWPHPPASLPWRRTSTRQQTRWTAPGSNTDGQPHGRQGGASPLSLSVSLCLSCAHTHTHTHTHTAAHCRTLPQAQHPTGGAAAADAVVAAPARPAA